PAELVGGRDLQAHERLVADLVQKEELDELRAPEAKDPGLGVEDAEVRLGEGHRDLNQVRRRLHRSRQRREEVLPVTFLRFRGRGGWRRRWRLYASTHARHVHTTKPTRQGEDSTKVESNGRPPRAGRARAHRLPIVSFYCLTSFTRLFFIYSRL